MKIKLLVLVLICSFCSATYAQDFYVTSRKDTIHGSKMWFTTNGRGFLTDLEYINDKGEKVEIHKKKNLGHIVCLKSGGTIYDRMPLKTKKPYGYHRFGQRLLSGKIKVSLYDNRHETTSYNPNSAGAVQGRTGPYQTTTSGTRLFQVTMPDGLIYSVNKKNIKKVIKPYLLQCEAFAKQYDGKFSSAQDEFVDMIGLYNDLCE